MTRRSTPLIGVGAAALAVGALATFAGISSDGPKKVRVGQTAAGAQTAEAPAFKIPEGRQALAVSLDSVAGTAGIAKAGSRIDVFAAVTKKGANGDDNAARLIIQNVEVLQVQTGATPLKDAPTGNPVFVLAVSPTQAEKLVYHASFSRLWFSVVNANAPAVPPTPGVNRGNELQPEAA